MFGFMGLGDKALSYPRTGIDDVSHSGPIGMCREAMFSHESRRS